MAGTAVTKIWENKVQGGVMQGWTFSLDPASIAAGAQGIETVALPGARTGDPVSVNVRTPETNLIVQGATVTASDVVSVYLCNNITVTTALDGAARVYDMTIIKLAGGDVVA